MFGGLGTVVSYDKLRKMLDERKMLKVELVKASKISTNVMAKLGKRKTLVWVY